MKAIKQKITAIGDPTNDAAQIISFDQPYVAKIDVVGSASILFHRWSVDGVEAKARAAKGSKSKKEDDVPSYVYRTEDGFLAVPSEYFRQSIIAAAKYKQDPRSPRKSAMDLFKAGLACLTDLNSLGKKDWDFVDRRRVTIQRNGITRCRPAMFPGWKVQFELQILLPEYLSPTLVNETIASAGRLIGICDFRPTFGRFQVTGFETR